MRKLVHIKFIHGNGIVCFELLGDLTQKSAVIYHQKHNKTKMTALNSPPDVKTLPYTAVLQGLREWPWVSLLREIHHLPSPLALWDVREDNLREV